jgi:hypothetical protein
VGGQWRECGGLGRWADLEGCPISGVPGHAVGAGVSILKLGGALLIPVGVAFTIAGLVYAVALFVMHRCEFVRYMITQ